MDRTRQWGAPINSSMRKPQALWIQRADPTDKVRAVNIVDSWLAERRGLTGQVNWGINAWYKFEHLLRIRYIERQSMGPLKEEYSLTVQVRAMRIMENERALNGNTFDIWSDDEYGRYDEILRAVAAQQAVADKLEQRPSASDADTGVTDRRERDTAARW